jgi:threonine/homoserine/homoserine lactone efflux protein
MQNPLYIFAVTALLSLLGSLQVGLVNSAVLLTAVKWGRNKAMQLALGGAIPEFVYASIAWLLSATVMPERGWESYAKMGSGTLLIGIGLYQWFSANKVKVVEKIAKKPINEQRLFVHGLFLGGINPQLLLYWLVVASGMRSFGTNMGEYGNALAFGLGAAAGALTLLFALATLGQKLQKYLNDKYLKRLAQITALLLVGTGVLVWVSMLL